MTDHSLVPRDLLESDRERRGEEGKGRKERNKNEKGREREEEREGGKRNKNEKGGRERKRGKEGGRGKSLIIETQYTSLYMYMCMCVYFK